MRIANAVCAVGVPLGIIAFAAAAVGSDRVVASNAEHATALQATEDLDRRECPGPYFEDTVVTSRQTVVVIKQTKLGGMISEVPEFHDCQRFLDRTSTKYGALFAVFASHQLDDLEQKATNDREHAYAAAEIVTRGSYAPLGIARKYNCLYLSAKDGWRHAYMVRSGENEDMCDPVKIPTTVPGAMRLSVRRVQVRGYQFSDYPAAARWHRTASGSYHIVLKCGTAWCEVGVPVSRSETASATNEAATKQHRVQDIALWHDQQILAVPGPGNPPRAKPSNVSGRSVPSANLGELTLEDFKDKWVPVSHVHMSDNIPSYESRLGFKRGWNRLEFRHSTGHAKWDARVTAADGSRKTMLDRVERFPHEGKGFNPPGTVRWRWMSNDETVWARCAEGCCQVQSNGTAITTP